MPTFGTRIQKNTAQGLDIGNFTIFMSLWKINEMRFHYANGFYLNFNVKASLPLKYKLPLVFVDWTRLGAHMVNRLLRENRKTIPKFLSGKKPF